MGPHVYLEAVFFVIRTRAPDAGVFFQNKHLEPVLGQEGAAGGAPIPVPMTMASYRLPDSKPSLFSEALFSANTIHLISNLNINKSVFLHEIARSAGQA